MSVPLTFGETIVLGYQPSDSYNNVDITFSTQDAFPHQVCSKLKVEILGASKPTGLNMIGKIS
jgi:hypothetical protein